MPALPGSHEEWWGMVAVADNGESCDIVTPREAYYALQDAFVPRPIPALSQWGLVVMVLLMLVAGSIVVRGSRRCAEA